jgi:putative ABC transport system permease protein
MENLIQDVRYSFRLLLKNPSFTFISVFALALGIGANTVIFSAFNAIMLRPLPYGDPDRIAMVWSSFPQAGLLKFGVPFANFADWKERNHVFDTIAIYQAASNTTYNLTGISGPERIQSAKATGDFFRVLNITPLFGRTIQADDEQIGKDHVVVVRFNLWQRYFGGDQHLVGKSIKLNDEDFQVVGIMPRGFQFPGGAEMPAGQQFASNTELWVPLAIPANSPARSDRVTNAFRAIARLKPGVTVQQAQAEMTTIAQKLEQENPVSNQDARVLVNTMRENQVGDLRLPMIVLLAAVGFVLLIACANIANLLLSRAAVRNKEFTIKRALGASRSRILRQLLTESVMLSVIGGVVGLGLSALAIQLLITFAPANIPRLNEVNLDLRVLGFTLLVSLITGVLFGMAPALQLSNANVHEGIKEGGRSVSGSGQNLLRSMLVISEVVLVFVLLIAAGLMIRSFRRLLDVAPGFDSENVLSMRVTLPARRYQGAKLIQFYHELLNKVGNQSGVKSAAIVRDLAFSGTDPRYGFTIEGRPTDQNQGVTYRFRVISPDYFKVMGIPLKSGRFFDDHDDQNGLPVVIINETTARQNWPGQNPVGQNILTGGGVAANTCKVIGIVGDIKFGGLDTLSDNEVFYPYPQIPEPVVLPVMGSMAVLLKTTVSPASLISGTRQQIASIDKDVPVSSMLTMEEVVANSVAPRRFNLLLLAVFAGIALVLAAVGIYGVISYWVAQRTREIGIRMALGAKLSDVFRLVIFQAMSMVLIGLGIGLIMAFGLTRALASLFSGLLFGVKATDPVTFISVAAILTVVAMVACLIPARRAAKVEPTVALRYE